MRVTTEDGYTLRVFESCFIDWGLEITDPSGNGVYYCPHALSNESYGYDWESEDGKPYNEGKPWTEERWTETLLAEADELIEAYTPIGEESN